MFDRNESAETLFRGGRLYFCNVHYHTSYFIHSYVYIPFGYPFEIGRFKFTASELAGCTNYLIQYQFIKNTNRQSTCIHLIRIQVVIPVRLDWEERQLEERVGECELL